MKTILIATLIAFTGAAQARMLSVELDPQRSNPARNVYVGTLQACPGTFQTVIPQVRKITSDAAVVDLKPVLDVSTCGTSLVPARYFLSIDSQLTAAGLDPLTAKVYFQLQ